MHAAECAELLGRYESLTTDAERAEMIEHLNAQDRARDARLSAPGALAAAAAWYASLGLPLFPVEPQGKRPLGRLAPHGCKDATGDPERVAAWWRTEPQANIGLATGHMFDVIDIDGPRGMQSLLGDLPRLDAEGGPWAQITAASIGEVKTPGGWHYYFDAVPGARNGASRWGAGVDTRALGGYVLAPPSIVGGRIYRWVTPLVIKGRA